MNISEIEITARDFGFPSDGGPAREPNRCIVSKDPVGPGFTTRRIPGSPAFYRLKPHARKQLSKEDLAALDDRVKAAYQTETSSSGATNPRGRRNADNTGSGDSGSSAD